MKRVILQCRGVQYRFLQFELRDQADGSLNIVFDRKGPDPTSRSLTSSEGTRTNVTAAGKIRISYHTSGRVQFHGTPNAPIYCEPLFDITTVQSVAAFHAPFVEKLEALNEERLDDIVLNITDEHKESLCFSLAVVPRDFITEREALVVDYEGLFKLAVFPGVFPDIPHMKDLLETHVVTVMMEKGTLAKQATSKYQALINFQQLLHQTQNIITTWNPSTGIYRAVYSVEMRVAPCLSVQFEDEQYSAEIVSSSPAETFFRVKGKGGYIKDRQVVIRGFELDARL